MKKKIKVAAVALRITELEPAAPLTSDNDISPTFGTVFTSYRVYFSEGLGEDIRIANDAVSQITNQSSHKQVKVAPDEPWVDITPSQQISDTELTALAVKLLSEALPQYDFCAAKDSYDVKVLTRKNLKINVSATVPMPGADTEDACVKPSCEARTAHRVRLSLTINEKPKSHDLGIIARQLRRIGFEHDLSTVENTELSESVIADKWADIIARNLTECRYPDSLPDVAFVAEKSRQRYELQYDMHIPCIRRFFGSTKYIPHIRVKDLEEHH